jgi:hypothetical protein
MRESTENCTSEPEVVVEATTKPERKKKARDTHLDASNPKGTMLFFSFLPSSSSTITPPKTSKEDYCRYLWISVVLRPKDRERRNSDQ